MPAITVAPASVPTVRMSRTHCRSPATKPIAAGEEILFDYGAGYWDSRLLPLDPRRLVIDYL